MLADIGVYSTQTYYIKRVIGLPGDHVVCCVNGKVTVNGVPLDETSYLFPGARPSMQPFNVIVPPGRLWVMGDNRAISDDSRGHMSAGFPAMGTIPENEVCGRAFMIIWPPSQIGDLPIPATFQQAALHAGGWRRPSGGAGRLGRPAATGRGEHVQRRALVVGDRAELESTTSGLAQRWTRSAGAAGTSSAARAATRCLRRPCLRQDSQMG